MTPNDVSKDQSEFALSETIGAQPVGKHLFRFSLPGVTSMLVGAAYNVVDTIYVGKLGHEAMAALTAVFPIQLIIVAVSAGIGVGAAIAAVISQVIVCIAILTFLFGPRTQFKVKAPSFIPRLKPGGKIFSAGVSMISIFFPRFIVFLFNRDPEFLPNTVHAVRIGFFCLALLEAQISFASFFQGIGKGHPAGIIGITRQLVIFVPAVIWAGILIYRLKIKNRVHVEEGL